jgi:predicted transglutaminase-like cysteine proteinase
MKHGYIIPVIISTMLLLSSSLFALSTREQQLVNAVAKTYGPRAAKRVESWRSEINRDKRLPESQKLSKINQFFNQLYFVNDINLWGKNDYWATPLEFLGANAGDCEDFTIAK